MLEPVSQKAGLGSRRGSAIGHFRTFFAIADTTILLALMGTRWQIVRMLIREDDLCGEEIAILLQEHVRDMAEPTPPESVHTLGLEGLRAPEITVWTAWQGGELLGCGALKELDARHGEIKSMHTARAHLRKRVASRILQHIISTAQRRNYRRLSLETGSMDVFEPARAFYTSFGFEHCDPFADYVEDANSVFMTRKI